MESVKIRKHKKKCIECGFAFVYTVNDVREVKDLMVDKTVGLTVICPKCRKEYWIV